MSRLSHALRRMRGHRSERTAADAAVLNALNSVQTALWGLFRLHEQQRDPRSLLASGDRRHSQNDEDGIIREIFRRIGSHARTFVEFGVGDGTENNTRYLLESGWTGLWIEADSGHVAKAGERFASEIGAGRLELVNRMVTTANIDDLILGSKVGADVDLLSIDIDGIDYWVWQAIRSIRPRVVVIEYNAHWPPPRSVTVAQDFPGWDGTDHFGASLSALVGLGREKGYSLVSCCYAGVNAFFVRDDLLGDAFSPGHEAADHFQPPRFGTVPRSGHPHRHGPVVEL